MGITMAIALLMSICANYSTLGPKVLITTFKHSIKDMSGRKFLPINEKIEFPFSSLITLKHSMRSGITWRDKLMDYSLNLMQIW
jgi:hypothetical protein